MDESTIGRLRRVPLRDVWKHEAYDFSTWLVDNLDLLNEHLEVPLVSAETEQAAGTFSVDLLAEDENGNQVIIENQLERSNHDHLGKVITYLASFEAVAAIWIVSDPRPEHVTAVSWLNESSSASFYLFKVEAVRIGDSLAAPLLTRFVGPSEETREIASTKKQRGERQEIRRAFWNGLLSYARARNKLHAGRTSNDGPYLGSPMRGAKGIGLTYGVGQHRTSAIAWIDDGPGSETGNLAAFEVLRSRKSEIEEAFGGPLQWQSDSDVRSCKLACPMENGGWRDEELWPQVYAETVEAMERLEAAIRPHLPAIKAQLATMGGPPGSAASEGDEEPEDPGEL